MVIEMKEYFIFKIKKELVKLYKNRPSDLFDVLNRIYYMKTIDLEYGKNLFSQVACFLDKDKLNKYIEDSYINNFVYQRCDNDHVINNLYYGEVSVLKVKNTHIKIETNKDRSMFFDILSKYDECFFACDFKEQEYFFVNKKIKLML